MELGVWHWKLPETQNETRSTKRTKFYLRVELAICAIALPEWTCLFWHDDGSAGHTKAPAERVLECCYHMTSSNFGYGYGYGFYFSSSSCFSQLPKVNYVGERRDGGRHEWDLTLTAVYLNALTHSAHTCAQCLCVYGCIGYLSGRAYLGGWEGRLFCDASLNYLVCTALEWKLLENLISQIYSCFLFFVATASFGPCSNDRKQVCSNN